MFERMMSALQKERSSKVNSDESNFDSTRSGNAFKFLPRIEFSVFDGSNPRLWIKKCSRYFSLCKIPEPQRVDLASIHLKGRAEVWFSSYIAVKKNVEWDEFIMDVCGRFKQDLGCRVVEDFNKLQQTGPIDEYLERFEELKSLMIQRTPTLPDVFFVDSFISGLKPQLKPFVKALNPETLQSAISFARLQEEALEAWKTPTNRHHPPTNHLFCPLQNLPYQLLLPNHRLLLVQVVVWLNLLTRISELLGSFQQLKGLRRVPKGCAIFVINPMKGAISVQPRQFSCFCWKFQERLMKMRIGRKSWGKIVNQLGLKCWKLRCISLQAVNGVQGYQTMRLTGHHGHKSIQILVDSSTVSYTHLTLPTKRIV